MAGEFWILPPSMPPYLASGGGRLSLILIGAVLMSYTSIIEPPMGNSLEGDVAGILSSGAGS